MRSPRRVLVALAATLVLLLTACGDDDTDDVGVGDADASGDLETPDADGASDGGDSDGGPAASGGGGGTVTFDGEEITITRVRCFFEEQPRAGLGGVFTHTAQADGVNAAGVAIVLDTSRAIGDDGAVDLDISFDIGDPYGDDAVSYGTGGTEPTISFDDDGVSGSDVAMSDYDDFQAGPVTLSFDLSCS